MHTSLASRRWISLLCGLLALMAAFCLMLGAAAHADAVEFDPESIISDANMRDYDSMSASETQTFLESQTGILDTLVTTDNAGVYKPASTIVWEACQTWRISPKVMLTMLQKEQSLLTRTTLATNTLSRAIGAGCPDAKTNKYPGFGQQMYNGARLLNTYGEGNPNFPTFTPGMSKTIYKIDGKTHIHPKNLGTFKLYVYNPSIGATMPYGDLTGKKCSGNASFWLIFRKYFGDPLGAATLQPVVTSRCGAHGSITPNGKHVVSLGSDSPTFTVKPDRRYRIADVRIDGVSIGASSTVIIRSVTASHTIAATFVANTCTLGAPVAPKTMKRTRYYTVYGSLKPKHSAGSRPVRIYTYRKVAGKWKPYGYVTAKAYNHSSYTRYKAKMRLSMTGSWRLRAYAPADSKHAATWSAKYDYVKVR